MEEKVDLAWVQDFLDINFCDKKKVESFHISPVTKGGFLSTAFILQVIGVDFNEKFFIKFTLEDEFVNKLHLHEIEFYQTWQKTHSLPFIPKYFNAPKSDKIPISPVILECIEETEKLSFIDGLPLDKLECILPIIAKTHFHLDWYYPGDEFTIQATLDFSSFLESLWENTKGIIHRTFKENNIFDKYSSELLILDQIMNNLIPILNYLNNSPTISKAITNGDCWTENILVCNEGMKLVDWQFWKLNNPLSDVALLLCSGVNENIRIPNENTLITCYYKQLEQSGIDKNKYSFETCWNEYELQKLFALIVFAVSFDAFYDSYKEKHGEKTATNILPRFSSLLNEASAIFCKFKSTLIKGE